MTDELGITFDAWVNPLAFLAIDEPWASMGEFAPDIDSFLRFLCTPGIDSDIKSLAERYKQISQEPTRLVLAPAEKHILDKLVWPLRQAKGCFMVGNYLGTISLCGMVAEMIAILSFEISPHQMGEKPMDKSKQTDLFGSSFEKLGQQRRVSVLRGLGLIDDGQKELFDLIKNKRNRYLHLYSVEHDELASDAIKVFQAAASLVVNIIGQDIRQGKVILNPAMAAYLANKGFAKIIPPENSSS